MGTTVDSIDIQITADAKKAESAIDSLVKKMDKLIKSMGSIDVSAISKQTQKISDSFSNVNVKGLENISKSAKEAEASVKKISSAAKSMGSAKMSFNVSDYQKVIKELSGKFADAGKGISFDGNLQSLEKQAEKLSKSLENLMQKEEEIIAVGKKSPEGEIFQRLQYNISSTINRLDALYDKISGIKQAASDVSGIDVNRWDANRGIKSEGNIAPKKTMIPESATQYNADLMASVFGEQTRNIKNWQQYIKEFGNSASSAFSFAGKQAENFSQKTDSIGNKVKELKLKLKELEGKGLSFGDAEYDKVHLELEKAKEDLKEYKASLKDAGNESSNFSNKSVPSFQKVTSVLNSMGSGVSNFVRRSTSLSLPFSNATKGSFSLTKSLGKLSIAFLSLRGIGNIVKKSIDISSDLTEVQNVVDVAFGKYTKAIEDFSKVSISDYGMSELTAKQIAGRFQAMGTAIGYSQKQMSGMSVELTKLAADMASFYNVEQEDVAKSLQSVFTGTTQPLRKYGIDLTNATLEEWAHKQGVDAKIKSMNQAEKAMLRYQYVMSQTGAAQGDFARTANTWANQIRILKQNFEILGSTIGGVLINALKPFVKGLNAIMGQINSFAKMISNALGKIFGWTYEEGGGVTNPADDMADSMGDVADATDDATKAQKAYNKQLSKFDELNNYTTSDKSDKDKDSGVGDLSGLGASGGAWKQGKSILKAYESEIDSLYELGAKIGETLKNAMDSIDWQGVYDKAEGFGTGLANFLNGLISPGLFSSLGATIAGGLNTALHFLNSFGTTFDWKNFGNSIAAGINSFFNNFDFALLAATFNTWANGILMSMITAVQGVDWKNVANKIVTLINGIDASGIFWNLGKLVNSLANAFYTLVSNKETWTALGTKIADGINGFFEGMNDVDKKTGLTGFQALGKSISETIKGIASTITTALEKVNWDEVGQSIGDFIASIDFAGIAWKLLKLTKSLVKAIGKAIKGFTKTAPIESAIISIFSVLKFTGLGKAIFAKLAKKIMEKIALAVGAETATLSGISSAIAGGIGSAFAAVPTLMTSSITTLGAATAGEIAATLVTSLAAALVSAFAGFQIGKYIGNALVPKNMEEYKYKWKFSDLFDYDLEEWKQGFKDMFENWNLAGMLDSFMSDIVSGDYKFNFFGLFEFPSYNEWTSKLNEMITDITDAWGLMVSDITGGDFKFKIGNLELPSWNDIQEKLGKLWENIEGWWDKNVKLPKISVPSIGDIQDAISKKWNEAKDWWNDKVKLPEIKLPKIADIKKGILNAWNNAKSWWKEHVKLPEIKFPKILTDTVKKWLKPIVTVANAMIAKINDLLKVDWKDIKVAGKTIIKGGSFTIAQIPKIQGYATGGFPDKASLFWAGENGVPEIVGTQGGKPSVAGGKEITGIKDEISRASSAEVSLLMEQNRLLRQLLAKDTGITTSEVFNAVRDEDNAFYKRNGHSAFSW